MKVFFDKIWHAMTNHKIITIIISVFLALVISLFICLDYFIFSRNSRGIVPTDAQLSALKENDQVYDHVVIFGVDGAGAYFGQMETPGFDSVFHNETLNSSVSYKTLSQFPTESAQNWGSMIHGVHCLKHKLNNQIAGSRKYTDTKYPSIFKVYGERHPDAYMASVVDWSTINYGIIEDGISNLAKINAGDYVTEDLSGLSGIESEKIVDTKVAELAIHEIQNNNPTILFTHFDCVDAAGHATGTGKPEYIDAMQHVDNLIGQIYQACVDQGWQNNTLFVCVADHGHEYNGGHGSNNDVVKYVTFAVAGGKGNIMKGTPGYAVTQDVAAVVFYALGEKQYSSWDCSVPRNMFEGLK